MNQLCSVQPEGLLESDILQVVKVLGPFIRLPKYLMKHLFATLSLVLFCSQTAASSPHSMFPKLKLGIHQEIKWNTCEDETITNK